ncbi:MAG: hypothetical protein IPL60_09505 [Ardenticatenia bacterium]|nr:hypothetical protein [Ardenticatenia bacterium]
MNKNYLSDIVIAEYEYIAHTASEAHEDRARVTTFYQLAVGSLVAALLGSQMIGGSGFAARVGGLLSGLFLLLTCLGVSTLLQLARLRVAWHGSVVAMDRIKTFAIKNIPELKDAFLWGTCTIPKPFTKGSVSHLQAVEVSVTTGIMFGSTIYFGLGSTTFANMGWTKLAIAVAAIVLMSFQLVLYKTWTQRAAQAGGARPCEQSDDQGGRVAKTR